MQVDGVLTVMPRASSAVTELKNLWRGYPDLLCRVYYTLELCFLPLNVCAEDDCDDPKGRERTCHPYLKSRKRIFNCDPKKVRTELRQLPKLIYWE